MTRRLLPLLSAALLLAAGTAQATSQQAISVMNRWSSMDKCARAAQAAFPDFTPESNAKRDARMKECLNSGNLPPREPLSPSR